MNQPNLPRNASMLRGRLAKRGYMRWWHSFCGRSEVTGEIRTFFIEFLIMNPGLGTSAAILGQHPYYKKKGMKPSYVCIKAGVFPSAEGNDGMQLHNFYPIDSLRTTPSPLLLQVEGNVCSEERLEGSVSVTRGEARHASLMSDTGSMEWNLEVHKAVSCNTGILASPLFQAINALDSYWHGEGIKSFFRGTVVLNGLVYEVLPEFSNGYADKHWGKSFNRPWMQFACGKLTSEKSGQALRHSVLAINGCCPRFLFLPLRRKLLIQLTYTGEDFDYGFQPFLLSRVQWETKENSKRFVWHILAQNKTSIIKISGSCTKEQMLEIRYEDPDGNKSPLPLLAGSSAVGKIELYKRQPAGRELIDVLHMEQGFCEYRPM